MGLEEPGYVELQLLAQQLRLLSLLHSNWTLLGAADCPCERPRCTSSEAEEAPSDDLLFELRGLLDLDFESLEELFDLELRDRSCLLETFDTD